MRHPDWQLRLEAFARERARMPFEWGRNDCALFAADCVEALTGEHLCPELRGHADVREALRVLRSVGGVRAIATRALGQPAPVMMAGIGDVLVVQTGKREALAVCNGGCAILPGPSGMACLPMNQALAAWKVS